MCKLVALKEAIVDDWVTASNGWLWPTRVEPVNGPKAERRTRSVEVAVAGKGLNGEHIQRMDDAAVHALALPPHVERAMIANMAVLRALRSEITALETILHQGHSYAPNSRP
ncbi:hypothetical protein WQE_39929 [Paraburkholderia hospita]|uniref:Uncharacterized protein n=1 Tax=Paraburkholderia hospita TaxID=169430 RepID=A0ABN0F9F4_9BURK|nr:hypothetical protein [Paraburkholderia hospita]EIM95301.1 hypothetical protein WQE_39929 [Paraburkholderia hospita]OUL84667.1 hypothetical protein CA602_19330 [Paraburkholderia hospita]